MSRPAQSHHAPGQDDRILYRGKKIDLALRPVTLSDGTTAEREVVLHRGAVALLPLLDGGARVCLIRNRRYAINKTLLEVPAGTIDPGEPPDACALRELREETGYIAGRLSLLTEWWVSPGLFTERMYLFRCDDLRPGPHARELDEQIEPVEVPWEQAVAMALDGRIEDAKSMLAILYWDRMRRESGA
ncbi:NUDIX hydrolase [Tautonia sociabilis]|uniref:GDP-mannose pyrophosphatase n=1 Tax=Tautonia sociabilis TaxID=2080755 RepID=A0A432MJT0_9BACT|nr:NUDIX hydrolase [Tautonia sociabilis]RUL87663.1 NUDIX hydrolase [Tautonia sociabilis]